MSILDLKQIRLGKWLPFEARVACFNYLKEWCGYGDSSAVTEERYNAIISTIKTEKAGPSALAILEIERKITISIIKMYGNFMFGSNQKENRNTRKLGSCLI